MAKTKILSMYDDTNRESDNLKFEPTLTQQQFRDECDINNILKKYDVNAVMLQGLALQHNFQDFSREMSFDEAQNAIAEANSSFERMPAEIRKQFDNNPSKLVAFLEDPDNLEKAVKIGLVERPKPIEATPVAPKAAEPATTPVVIPVTELLT